MTCVDVDRAREMRENGLTLAAIGEEFGVSRERIRQLVGSPARAVVCGECGESFVTGRASEKYCSSRCQRRHAARSVCACGAPKHRNAKKCHGCQRTSFADARHERYGRLVELWARGLSMEQVADELGTTKNALGGEMVRARAAGYDLPRRRAAKPSVPVTKDQCRRQFQHAIRHGQVRRSTRCERCGDVALTDGHHTDYSKPLYVEWLCRPCHAAHHVEERSAA